MIEKLPGGPLCLWHCLGPLYYFDTSCGLFTIMKIPGTLYNCETSWSFFIIVVLPVPPYDCDTSWAFFRLWYFLGPLYDSWSCFMIVILPLSRYDCVTCCASFWLWHYMVLLYDCGISCGLWLLHFLWPLYDYDTSWGNSFFCWHLNFIYCLDTTTTTTNNNNNTFNVISFIFAVHLILMDDSKTIWHNSGQYDTVDLKRSFRLTDCWLIGLT